MIFIPSCFEICIFILVACFRGYKVLIFLRIMLLILILDLISSSVIVMILHIKADFLFLVVVLNDFADNHLQRQNELLLNKLSFYCS